MPSHNDPLEAAKISQHRGPGRPPNNSKSYTVVSPPPKSETQPPQSLTSETQVEVMPAFEPVAEERRMRSFKVLETRTMSWMGSVTTLSAGGVVTEGGYSIAGIQRLLDQGVKLEEII